MSGTGCAMLQQVVAAVRPSVLLVEEAAEVLEPQITPGLPHRDHLSPLLPLLGPPLGTGSFQRQSS